MPPPRPGLPAWAIALIVIAVVIVVVGVIGAVMFIRMMPIDGRPPTRPQVTFSTAEFVTNGFEFTVAGASQSRPAANYQVTLLVNQTSGVALPLSVSTSFTIGGNTYTVTYTDIGGEGALTGGDIFIVTRAGGLLDGTEYTFVLLWSDGAQIGSVSYP